MDKTVKMFLIWRDTECPQGFSLVKEFSNLLKLNAYLSQLDSEKILEIKVVSGITLEERTND